VSTDDPLSDEDQALLEHIDQDIEAADDADELEALARELRDQLRDQRAALRTLEQRFQAFQQATDQRLTRLEESEAVRGKDEVVPLETWLQLDAEAREKELSTSEQIALVLHEHWQDIAWTMGGGSNYAGTQSAQRIGVDTNTTANAKYNPSRLKHRLKQALDFEPHHEQIHRGLKRLADATGGEEFVDDAAGRTHIVGGWYQYHEKATPDGADTKRVLWRDEDD